MMMKSYYGCQFVDIWCVIEALFFIACKLKVRYLQSKDPLECHLSAAPMLDPDERKALWEHILSAESDPSWLVEWFLDRPSIDSISLYDILDLLCWAMFDGRNQEHLTTQELNDLEDFVEDLEYHISLHLYGIAVKGEEKIVTESKVTMKENNEEAILEREEKDGPEVTMKLNKTSSDAATASVNTKRNGNYDLSSIDETEYGSPLKTMMIRSSVGEERTSSSKSRFRSSLTILSIERPCPKKCEWKLVLKVFFPSFPPFELKLTIKNKLSRHFLSLHSLIY